MLARLLGLTCRCLFFAIAFSILITFSWHMHPCLSLLFGLVWGFVCANVHHTLFHRRS